ncbi:MAG: hypothetical protein LBD87_05580 [Prevotellaceae bacterium]|jgi:hypothetical protein|nr:hypothetical protein [Prevotellaceae bacterium]
MKNFSNIRGRILQIIEYKGINKRKFYMETGVSNGVLDKKGTYSLDTIEKIIATYSDINLEWLLTGHGYMTGNFSRSDLPDSFSGNQDNTGNVILNLSTLTVELAKSNTELIVLHQKLLKLLGNAK